MLEHGGWGMALFSYEQIKGMNPGEFRVYNFVASHLNKAHEMNIRQLAGAVGVSTTTVLRFCEKVGCSGYTELKYLSGRQPPLRTKRKALILFLRFSISLIVRGIRPLGKSWHRRL